MKNLLLATSRMTEIQKLITEDEEVWLPIKGKRITRQQFYALVEMVDIAQPK